jgi:hypothetical protein
VPTRGGERPWRWQRCVVPPGLEPRTVPCRTPSRRPRCRLGVDQRSCPAVGGPVGPRGTSGGPPGGRRRHRPSAAGPCARWQGAASGATSWCTRRAAGCHPEERSRTPLVDRDSPGSSATGRCRRCWSGRRSARKSPAGSGASASTPGDTPPCSAPRPCGRRGRLSASGFVGAGGRWAGGVGHRCCHRHSTRVPTRRRAAHARARPLRPPRNAGRSRRRGWPAET